MEVDETTVRRIARLARIEIGDTEATSLKSELNNILQWVEQLAEVDTDGVEPMTSVRPMSLKQRDDVVSDGDQVAAVTANAPFSNDGFYVVPKVVE